MFKISIFWASTLIFEFLLFLLIVLSIFWVLKRVHAQNIDIFIDKNIGDFFSIKISIFLLSGSAKMSGSRSSKKRGHASSVCIWNTDSVKVYILFSETEIRGINWNLFTTNTSGLAWSQYDQKRFIVLFR